MKKTFLVLGIFSALAFGAIANAEEQTSSSDDTSVVITESSEFLANEQNVTTESIDKEEDTVTEESAVEDNEDTTELTQEDTTGVEGNLEGIESLTGISPRINITVEFIDVHRVYNKNTGSHHYTTNWDEVLMLVHNGWKHEGLAWKSPKSIISKNVIRLYNRNADEHLFTINGDEIWAMTNVHGWVNEGRAFWAMGSKDTWAPNGVYRLYNPNAGPYRPSHHYTKNAAEKDMLVALGWRNEGIKFWVK